MLRCLFIKRKLYDFVAGELGLKEKAALSRHLQVCSGCRRKAGELKTVFSLAAKREKLPLPDEAFWGKFQVELNKRLDQETGAEFAPEPEARRQMRHSYLFRPVLAYASVLLLMMVTVFSLYRYYQPKIHAYQDQQIVEEVLFLEELNGTNGTTILPLGDAYIQEIDIISRYSS
ncbi:MAG: zf-HC2 domain-containing protein [Candidatus Omnitrophica bacterium]|nr:zf-HC2 domain-containing protein [Candidatus Omnitrophota bacterium]